MVGEFLPAKMAYLLHGKILVWSRFSMKKDMVADLLVGVIFIILQQDIDTGGLGSCQDPWGRLLCFVQETLVEI